MYDPDDCLMISGLQHFRFCRRQWALIHIEQQWAENLRTTEGAILHERAHDEQLRESRGDTIIDEVRLFDRLEDAIASGWFAQIAMASRSSAARSDSVRPTDSATNRSAELIE